MTRRDFELIAETIRDSMIDDRARDAIARNFAGRLRSTNPRFNQDRFLKAAGVSE